jgi:hypothetical protein
LSRSVLEEGLALDLGDSGVKLDTLVERDWAGKGGAREGERRRESGEGRHGGCAGSEVTAVVFERRMRGCLGGDVYR